MSNKRSFYTNCFSAVSWCFNQFVCVGCILIAVFSLKGATWYISMRSIFVVLLFVVLPVLFFIHSFSTFSSCFSRIHISADGLRCTVLGKETKQIGWSEIKFSMALQTDRLHGTYIIYSTHDITQTIYDDTKKKWKMNIFFLNGKKNDLFFLPYKKSVLQLLPEDLLPNQVYHYYEPLP